MAYYGGGPGGLRRALFPQLNYENMIGQEQPDQMRQLQPRVLPDPGQVPTPPQVGPGTMSPQERGALGRGGTAQYLYPDERQIRRGANRPNVQPTGTQNLMSALVGDRPRSEEDLGRLDMAKNMGLIGSGLSLISTIGGVQRPDLPGHPGSLGRNLADALSTGITTARGIYGESEPEQPEFITGPGGGIYEYDPETREFRSRVAGKPETQVLGNELLVEDPSTGQWGPRYEGLTDDETIALRLNNIDPQDYKDGNLTQEQRTELGTALQELNSSRASRVTVGGSTADSAGGALGSQMVDWLGETRSGAQTSVDLLQAVAKADELLDIIPDDAFRFGGGVRQWIDQNVDASPEKDRYLAAVAEFQTQVAQVVLAQLSAFPGQISDSERRFVESFSGMNFSESREQIRGRLNALATKFRAPVANYISFYDSFDPAQYNISAAQMAPYQTYYDQLKTISQQLDESAAARLLARGGFN